jgi:hypothetical protein
VKREERAEDRRRGKEGRTVEGTEGEGCGEEEREGEDGLRTYAGDVTNSV